MDLGGLGVTEQSTQRIEDGGETLFEAEQPRRARLGDQHPAWIEPRLGDRVELLRVEQGSGTAFQRVNEIKDDCVVGIRGVFQVATSVFVNQICPGIVEAALVVVGEVFAAKRDHFWVQIDHRGAFH